MTRRSHAPLHESLATLLQEKRSNHYGRWALRPFLQEVADAHGGYKPGGLRAMVEGKATANPTVLEVMARLLGVSPEYFLEYRLSVVRQKAETEPAVLDLLYDLAVNEGDAKRDLK